MKAIAILGPNKEIFDVERYEKVGHNIYEVKIGSKFYWLEADKDFFIQPSDTEV